MVNLDCVGDCHSSAVLPDIVQPYHYVVLQSCHLVASVIILYYNLKLVFKFYVNPNNRALKYFVSRKILWKVSRNTISVYVCVSFLNSRESSKPIFVTELE